MEPLLASYNRDGQIQGVKYDLLTVVLINAVKERQAQIESQSRSLEEQREQLRRNSEENQKQQFQIDRQQKQIEALKKLLCGQNAGADACKENK